MEQGFSVFIYFLKIICEFINLNKSSRAPYIPNIHTKEKKKKIKKNKKKDKALR